MKFLRVVVILCLISLFLVLRMNYSNSDSPRNLKSATQVSLESSQSAGTMLQRNLRTGKALRYKNLQEDRATFGRDGYLTQHAISELGLSKAQAKAVQQVYSNYLNGIAEEVSKRITVSKGAHSPENGVSAFYVEAFQGTSDMLLETAIGSLQLAIGTRDSEFLIDEMIEGQDYPGWGRNSSQLVFEEKVGSSGSPYVTLQWTLLDASSAEVVSEGEAQFLSSPGTAEYTVGLMGKIVNITNLESSSKVE